MTELEEIIADAELSLRSAECAPSSLTAYNKARECLERTIARLAALAARQQQAAQEPERWQYRYKGMKRWVDCHADDLPLIMADEDYETRPLYAHPAADPQQAAAASTAEGRKT